MADMSDQGASGERRRAQETQQNARTDTSYGCSLIGLSDFGLLHGRLSHAIGLAEHQQLGLRRGFVLAQFTGLGAAQADYLHTSSCMQSLLLT